MGCRLPVHREKVVFLWYGSIATVVKIEDPHGIGRSSICMWTAVRQDASRCAGTTRDVIHAIRASDICRLAVTAEDTATV